MKKAAAYFSLTVLLAACTGTESTTTSTVAEAPSASASTASPTNSPSPPDAADEEELPVVPLLGAAQDPAGMGERIELVADQRLSGDVYLVGPDGDLSTGVLTAGSGSISVPTGLSPGLYGLRLNQGDAWGTVTVVDSPGLLIRGAPYVGESQSPRVEVYVHGIDPGMVVAVELESGGTVERMVPHPLLGLAPVPATSPVRGVGEGRHQLVLPQGFTGTVRLVVGDHATLADPYSETSPAVVSNELRISTCDEATRITGDLGIAGVVTVRSAGTADTTREATDDGGFEIAVPAGTNLVAAFRDDGNHPPPRVVNVQCGAILDVGDLTERIDTGPQAGTYLGGLTLDDLWLYTTSATGDLEFSQEGFADCTVVDGALEVTFGASSADPWLYQLTLDPPIYTGRYEARLHLEDIFTRDTANGILSGEIEVGRIDDLDAVGGVFSGTIDGTLGSIDLDISFTCATFSLTGSLRRVNGELIRRNTATFRTLAQAMGGRSYGEECKTLFVEGRQPEGAEGFVDTLMEYWAAGLMQEVPRVSILTVTDIRAMFEVEAMRQLFGDFDTASIDIAGAIDSNYLLKMKNEEGDGSWALSAVLYDLERGLELASLRAHGESAEAAAVAALDRWTELVDPLAKAGICVEFEPESAVVDVGSDHEFTVEVTDLAGDPAEEVEVTKVESECGSWDPSSGPVDATAWQTTFTAGDRPCRTTDWAAVEADGTGGTVKGSADVSITTEAMWQWITTITFEDEHNRITAEASGEFFVESDFDALIGSGTGYVEGSGEAYCEVNGAVTWQPTELSGEYKVMVSGAVTERPEIDAPWTVEFAPSGFGINTDITYKTSSDCIEAGTYSNDLLGFLAAGALVMYPHWYANQPGGFVTYMNPAGDGVPFEDTLIGLPGATIRGTIWKPQP